MISISSKLIFEIKGLLINMTYDYVIRSYIVKIYINGVHQEKELVGVNYSSVYQFSCQDRLT